MCFNCLAPQTKLQNLGCLLKSNNKCLFWMKLLPPIVLCSLILYLCSPGQMMCETAVNCLSFGP